MRKTIRSNRFFAQCLFVFLFGFAIRGFTQNTNEVNIDVNFNSSVGEMYSMWAYFGYDEPNYTYMPNEFLSS